MFWNKKKEAIQQIEDNSKLEEEYNNNVSKYLKDKLHELEAKLTLEGIDITKDGFAITQSHDGNTYILIYKILDVIPIPIDDFIKNKGIWKFNLKVLNVGKNKMSYFEYGFKNVEDCFNKRILPDYRLYKQIVNQIDIIRNE